MYMKFPWKEEIATLVKSMVLKYLGKTEVLNSCLVQVFLLDELALMLSGAAAYALLKIGIKEWEKFSTKIDFS